MVFDWIPSDDCDRKGQTWKTVYLDCQLTDNSNLLDGNPAINLCTNHAVSDMAFIKKELEPTMSNTNFAVGQKVQITAGFGECTAWTDSTFHEVQGLAQRLGRGSKSRGKMYIVLYSPRGGRVRKKRKAKWPCDGWPECVRDWAQQHILMRSPKEYMRWKSQQWNKKK